MPTAQRDLQFSQMDKDLFRAVDLYLQVEENEKAYELLVKAKNTNKPGLAAKMGSMTKRQTLRTGAITLKSRCYV